MPYSALLFRACISLMVRPCQAFRQTEAKRSSKRPARQHSRFSVCLRLTEAFSGLARCRAANRFLIQADELRHMVTIADSLFGDDYLFSALRCRAPPARVLVPSHLAARRQCARRAWRTACSSAGLSLAKSNARAGGQSHFRGAPRRSAARNRHAFGRRRARRSLRRSRAATTWEF